MQTDLYAYNYATELYRLDAPFYALLMAAMLRADSINADKLRFVFPNVWNELQARYNAPGGILPEEPVDSPRVQIQVQTILPTE